MRCATTVLSFLAAIVLTATGAQATDMGYVILQSGDDPNNYHDLTDGSMWLNTGSGPQLIPDRWNTSFYDTDHSSDINVEVLAGLSSTNLQLVASPSNSAFTSIYLLSVQNPNGDAVANSAEWDMNWGDDDGVWSPLTGSEVAVPGSTGSAYFRVYAWTGLYNTYQAAYNASAAGQAVYVADSGVFQGVTCPGGANPIPNMTWPAMVLAAAPTPEPSTILLAVSGLLGLLAYAWRKRK